MMAGEAYGQLPAGEVTVWRVHFPCNCLTGRWVYPVGTACPRCGCDGVTTHCTLAPSRSLIWIDDYGSNGPQGARWRCFFDGRADEIVTGGKPSWGAHG